MSHISHSHSQQTWFRGNTVLTSHGYIWWFWLFATNANFKGALYGIEPSTQNSKIWPTREEAAPSVPKKILLNLNKTRTPASLFQSVTDVSTTALSRITFKSHELKIATTVITRHACLVSCRSFVHRSAAQHRQRQQDIFRYWRCCLSWVGQI